ncbi:MAG: glycosyl transferase, partial [Bacteroides thetaiotaomicron]|nr:glycosyl transferase [Bacteroides thetaiotaomicron]
MGLDGKIYFAHISHNLTKVQSIKDADIINLHWVSDGFLNEKDIEKLSAMGKKIVWTMHDMFSFTGGCYYDKDCGGYTSGCECCTLAAHTQTGQKLLQEQIKRKIHLSRSANITYIGCSSWITNCAKKSDIIRGSKVINIPNPIETEVFAPIDRNKAKAT